MGKGKSSSTSSVCGRHRQVQPHHLVPHQRPIVDITVSLSTQSHNEDPTEPPSVTTSRI